MDAGWLAGIALIAVAAWQPRRPVVAVRVDGFWAFALPTGFGALALGLLVYDHFRALHACTRPLRRRGGGGDRSHGGHLPDAMRTSSRRAGAMRRPTS